MNGRVAVPYLADHSAIALSRLRSLSVRVGRWVRGRSAAPVVEHSTPTILGHVFHYLTAAISVAVKMATGARNLIAQARFYRSARGHLMQ